MLDGEALRNKIASAISSKQKVAFDIEALQGEMVVTVPGKTKHQLDKMLAHGIAYSMGKSDDILDPLPHWAKVQYAQAAGRSTRGPYESTIVTAYRRAIEKLTTEETYWANAFRDEAKAKPDFYAKAPPERRRWLEKHYTALAKEDSKRGERAARVLVHRTMHALEGEPAWGKPTTFFDFKGSQTGRSKSQHQIDAYRYLLESIPKAKP